MILANVRPALVVVGTGMAGARVVEDLVARAPDCFTIRMFGDEPHGTYNRTLLSSVLAGTQDPARLWLNPLEWYDKQGIKVHAGIKAEYIDRARGVVHGAGGLVEEPYDYLVLATGSRPLVPPLEGLDLEGVFLFRTLEDCAHIGQHARDSERAVVLGGGLLGLEAACGLRGQGMEVTVVELAPYLMCQQLDSTGAHLLRRQLEALGVRFRLETSITHILGEEGCVSGVRLRDGGVLEADLVVISCGIRPNIDLAKASGLDVERGIVVDDQLRTSDPAVFAVGECTQHRGQLIGLVEPVYQQARVLADVLSGHDPQARYQAAKPATTLKVMGVDLTVMGDVHDSNGDTEVVSHLDPAAGVYKKVLIRDGVLAGALLLGLPDPGGLFQRLYREGVPLSGSALDLLHTRTERDLLLTGGAPADLQDMPDTTQICNCHTVSKGRIVAVIKEGKCSIEAVGQCCRAGTGCGTCQPLLGELIDLYGKGNKGKTAKNKIEILKEEKDGLDALPDILKLAPNNNWQEMTEADKQRFKWHGLFFRTPTPGHFMMRVRSDAGRLNARQLRVLADVSDQYGKGFCDLTTREQIQLRWFTLADVPEIWRRLDAVGLHSKQTGMDNIRGICGCPVAGLTQHELLDATPVIQELSELILDNKEFTNLPRKFNVTVTGCMENCCHTETQDIALVPAYRELDGQQVNGFNVLVGGKQGSGGYRPAEPLDIYVRPGEAARLCAEITRIFRDHGPRGSRNKARMAFLLEERGAAWMRSELQRRWQQPLLQAGVDARKKHHVDHLGIHPQKHRTSDSGPQLHYAGLLVPVGRITTTQMRQVADLAERYGNGEVRVTVGQNLVIPNIPEQRIGAFTDEPVLKELPFDPSPILRGLVACTGNDYCHMALIDTKTYALEVARALEKRSAGRKVQPLTIHWSGCPAGCGLHQVSTIGLQGCRSRVNGRVIDAAHVCVNGRSGPNPLLATDLMYDVPCEQLADALEPLVKYLPRQ